MYLFQNDSPEQLQSHLNQKKPLQKNLLHEGDEMSIKTLVHTREKGRMNTDHSDNIYVLY